VREPGAGIGREMAAAERADAQIDAFISRRHEQRVRSEPERALDEAWREADRRLDVRRRRQTRAEWHGAGTWPGPASTGDCPRSTRARRED
jgi:hypothetical protein